MSNPQSDFLSSLTSAARENPLAAILVGGGALWLLAGAEGLKSAANSLGGAFSPIVEDGARRLRAAGDRLGAAEMPTAPETEDGEQPQGNVVSAAADTVKTRLDEGARYAREKIGALGNQLPGRASVTKAQSLIADIFERQPLFLGLAGVALGGAIASAFRASDIENELLGESSDDVKADLSKRAAAVSDTIRETSEALKSKIGEESVEAANRLKAAGIGATNAVRNSAKLS